MGLKDQSEIVGKTDQDFFSEEHADAALADEQKIIATGQPLDSFDEKETWPDGHQTWVSTTKVPWRDASGNVESLDGPATLLRASWVKRISRWPMRWRRKPAEPKVSS
jgi:hypothetical protein